MIGVAAELGQFDAELTGLLLLPGRTHLAPRRINAGRRQAKVPQFVSTFLMKKGPMSSIVLFEARMGERASIRAMGDKVLI